MKIELIIELATFIASILMVYFAIKSELRNNKKIFLSEIIENEKRHSKHEQNFALLKEKLDSLKELIYERIKEKKVY
jgi:hypothetical protein